MFVVRLFVLCYVHRYALSCFACLHVFWMFVCCCLLFACLFLCVWCVLLFFVCEVLFGGVWVGLFQVF